MKFLNLNKIRGWSKKGTSWIFGEKSLKDFGAKIFNNLPYYIKSSQNLEMFKGMIENWGGSPYNCLVCNS